MRIVLSRLDRLGDLILSTPAIRALRKAYPEADITLVCSSRNAAAAELIPDLDRYFVASNVRERREIARRLRGADVGIALAPRLEDMGFIRALRARRSLGYTYVRRYGVRLMARFCVQEVLVSQADPARSEADPKLTPLHEVDQLLALVQRAGADISNPELVLALTGGERAAATEFPGGAVLVHLAPRWLADGSSEASLLALLHELLALGRPVTVTYAAECAAVAERLSKAAARARFVGGLSFRRWAALIGHAACVVTVDTSATHVASAMRRPTVVLFEHRYFALNAREWAPWGVPAEVLRKPAGNDPESLARSRQDLVAAVGRLLSR